MKEDTAGTLSQPGAIGDSLTELLRRGARGLIEKAVEAELELLLEQYANVTDLSGRRAVVRNGHLPERDIHGIRAGAGAGPEGPRPVRERGQVQLGARAAVCPQGPAGGGGAAVALSAGHFDGRHAGGAVGSAGRGSKGLSPAAVSRLKAQWTEAYTAWNQRGLAGERYVYVWADGIYSTLRGEDDRLCLLVLVGVNECGEKRLLALSDGYRESKASWLGVLQDLRARGLETAPVLAIGDGALGIWAAKEEAWPETRVQRCWVHKTVNVLNELPKSIQGKAKAGLHEVWMAETKAQAGKAFDRFVRDFGAKYLKAVEKLVKDRTALLAFYDFPVEHWIHIRTTNPIESSFSTIRHRTTRTKNCVSRNTLLGLVFQLALVAEKSWRKLGGFKLLPEVAQGIRFEDGLRAVDTPAEPEENQQQIAA